MKLRVFQRNFQNVIIVWDANGLTQEQRSSIVVEVKFDTNWKPVTYSRFVCPNKEKFGDKLDGIVISQKDNDLLPSKPYWVKITAAKVIHSQILVQSLRENKSSETRLLAWDEKNNKYEKLYGTWVGNNFCLLVASEDKSK